MQEIKFYTMNLKNANIIEKKAIKNLKERYSNNLEQLERITNYDEIGIVEYVADNNYFIYNNKIYAGYMQINVNAHLFDGALIEGNEFESPLYHNEYNDLWYIPALKELKEKYGKGLEFVTCFNVIVSSVTEDSIDEIDMITYENDEF